MNLNNLNNIFTKIKYYFFRPLTYINIFFARLSKPSKLKILQWKKVISLFNEYDCKTLLEFGSGRSTIFFIKNLENFNEFLSINPNTEIKFTEIVREKYKSLNIKKNCKIINSETQISNISLKPAVNFFTYPFSDNYDLIYIDGRHNMIDELIKYLKKNNYKYKLTDSGLLNYTIIFV